jgi:hypothetical protein
MVDGMTFFRTAKGAEVACGGLAISSVYVLF